MVKQTIHFRANDHAQLLLNAMDGVAYVVSVEGRVVAVGRRGWDAIAASAGVDNLESDAILGADLFAAIHGQDVRNAYLRMHQKLCTQMSSNIRFEYRCDVPEFERHMLMNMSPIAGESGLLGVLYQSQMLQEIARIPIGLFAPENYTASKDGGGQTVLCSYCHRVAWPGGSREPHHEWISPEAYYARGGRSDTAISHGICPRCVDKIVEPNIA